MIDGAKAQGRKGATGSKDIQICFSVEPLCR